MIKYAKITNPKTGLCEVGIGTNIEFYKLIKMQELDVQQSDIDNQWYLVDKCPMKSNEEKLAEDKEQKVSQIKQELNELDLQTIRPLRALLASQSTATQTSLEVEDTASEEEIVEPETNLEEDIAKLQEIEDKVNELREQLRTLSE